MFLVNPLAKVVANPYKGIFGRKARKRQEVRDKIDRAPFT
jgi:hypothetical protein